MLFSMFFNVFMFMFASMGIFTYEYQTDSSDYDLDDPDNMNATDVFEDVSGQSVGGLLSLDMVSWIAMGGVIAASIALAALFRSPYPVAVGLFLATFINIYKSSESIIESFDLDPYIVVAIGIGVVGLFLITTIEYFTHGDA